MGDLVLFIHACLVPKRTDVGGIEETGETVLKSKNEEWVRQHRVDGHITLKQTQQHAVRNF